MSEFITGRRPVLEALEAGTPLEKIVLIFGARGTTLQRIRQLARGRGIPVSQMDKRRFSQLFSDANAQGVAAVVGSKAYAEIDDILQAARERGEPPFLLVLDEIEDPHNLGALIRTAECAGAHGAIIAKHQAASVGQTVAKTSAGASLRLPVARVTNVAKAIEELKGDGVWVVGADMTGDRLYSDVDYTGAIAVVVGNEGRGIRRLVKEKCDFIVTIPLYGKIASLNASVAGGLVLYEVARMRHKEKKV
ncbi:MAG: 23S rRNA (guanosine(2251)-2'-O)-methyltransferase RlmB [Ignavibacteria bacterium]|nr:23S rRNA (guanosine(2251)-2'-O)-methyltransferase RlmB [Ignavibacteria bacterium]